jgi:hypothetical protein
MRGHRHHRRRSRARRSVDGHWDVQARLERFAEPAALVEARERITTFLDRYSEGKEVST